VEEFARVVISCGQAVEGVVGVVDGGGDHLQGWLRCVDAGRHVDP